MSIASNLDHLRDQIATACAHAHRDPASVALMAVSKTHPAEAILEAYAAGQRLFGENRVQEFSSKSTDLAALGLSPQSSTPYPLFHLIGPLQSNKTTKAAELFAAIDTIDSLKTATRLSEAANALNKTLAVLIEVKLSPEATKHGLAPDELPALLHSLSSLTNVEVRGLMTVPPFTDDPTLARPYFQHLRRQRDENQAAKPTRTERSKGQSNALNKTLAVLIEVKLSPEATKHGITPEDLPTLLHALAALTHLEVRGLMTVPPFTDDPTLARPYFQHLRRLRDENLAAYPTLTELSMGMSNDFAIAIEEGATTIRIGTSIFGKRDYA